MLLGTRNARSSCRTSGCGWQSRAARAIIIPPWLGGTNSSFLGSWRWSSLRMAAGLGSARLGSARLWFHSNERGGVEGAELVVSLERHLAASYVCPFGWGVMSCCHIPSERNPPDGLTRDVSLRSGPGPPSVASAWDAAAAAASLRRYHPYRNDEGGNSIVIEWYDPGGRAAEVLDRQASLSHVCPFRTPWLVWGAWCPLVIGIGDESQGRPRALARPRSVASTYYARSCDNFHVTLDQWALHLLFLTVCVFIFIHMLTINSHEGFRYCNCDTVWFLDFLIFQL